MLVICLLRNTVLHNNVYPRTNSPSRLSPTLTLNSHSYCVHHARMHTHTHTHTHSNTHAHAHTLGHRGWWIVYSLPLFSQPWLSLNVLLCSPCHMKSVCFQGLAQTPVLKPALISHFKERYPNSFLEVSGEPVYMSFDPYWNILSITLIFQSISVH